MCMSVKLHRLFNSTPRYRWDKIDDIPFDNGVYIIFEEGETYHGFKRIVRVGTHDSDQRLLLRLEDHFVKENKNRSVFRKNIGKAILNKNQDGYLETWGKKSDKTKVNSEYQRKIEEEVSKFMRAYFSFTCFPVATKEERLRLEEGIIASLHCATDFSASADWFGKHSPETKIVQSGMWLKQGLSGTPLSEGEYANIEAYCAAAFSTDSRTVPLR